MKLSTLVALIFYGICVFNTAYSAIGDKPDIIPREVWGANEEYSSKESMYWQDILESWSQSYTKPKSESAQKAAAEKTKKINDYLNENFSKYFTLDETKYYNFEGGYSYAWPLKYTNFVDSIIVHHTDGEYPDSLTGIKNIHKFHSISRQWGDIGYNYIIGYNGEIYEGRDGGDYTSGAHSKYNNYGSIGISLLGNYNNKSVTDSQKESLESLIQYLVKHYGIDLSKKRYYHMNCSGDKCNTFPIETYLDSVLVGHKDTGHTSCPGQNLYPIIEEIRLNNLDFTAGFKPIYRNSSEPKNREESEYQTSQILIYKKHLSGYEKKQLNRLKKSIKSAIDSGKYSQDTIKKLQILNIAIVLSLKS